MGDIFVVEEDIASEISRGLHLKLAPRDETLLAKRHTENSEAYRLFLLSRHELNKLIPGRQKAVEYARQATEKDPTYAPAYAALADSYIWLGSAGQLPYNEAFSRAKTAAARALEIDETLPEGHAALASAVLFRDWDWAGAERGFKEAIELNPNSVAAHSGYGDYLGMVGRSREAIEHAKRAVELDPLSPRLHRRLAFEYYLDRQFDQALRSLSEVLELEPDLDTNLFLAFIHREKGLYEEAIAEFSKAAARHALGHLGNAYARAGSVREARECLRELKERLTEDKVGVYEVALIYAGLSEKDQAFEWLERAYEERDKGLIYLKVDPTLDPLRSDPRFQDLLRRMNFPS